MTHGPSSQEGGTPPELFLSGDSSSRLRSLIMSHGVAGPFQEESITVSGVVPGSPGVLLCLQGTAAVLKILT